MRRWKTNPPLGLEIRFWGAKNANLAGKSQLNLVTWPEVGKTDASRDTGSSWAQVCQELYRNLSSWYGWCYFFTHQPSLPWRDAAGSWGQLSVEEEWRAGKRIRNSPRSLANSLRWRLISYFYSSYTRSPRSPTPVFSFYVERKTQPLEGFCLMGGLPDGHSGIPSQTGIAVVSQLLLFDNDMSFSLWLSGRGGKIYN